MHKTQHEFIFRMKFKPAAVHSEDLRVVGMGEICSGFLSMRNYPKNGFCSAAGNLAGALGQGQGFERHILPSAASPLQGVSN